MRRYDKDLLLHAEGHHRFQCIAVLGHQIVKNTFVIIGCCGFPLLLNVQFFMYVPCLVSEDCFHKILKGVLLMQLLVFCHFISL